jgi:hypothetical protein
MDKEAGLTDKDLLKLSYEHSWDWFALHANQRMQCFNFFLVATGFLVAAYASAINNLPAVALWVSILGAWVAFWFNRLDVRSKDLIKAAENALESYEDIIATAAGVDSIKLVSIVEHPRRGVPSFSWTFRFVQSAIFLLFVAGAFYAVIGRAASTAKTPSAIVSSSPHYSGTPAPGVPRTNEPYSTTTRHK